MKQAVLSRWLSHPMSKPVFFVLCTLPFLWLLWRTVLGDLGANPVETVTHQTGDWALRMLLLTLSLTPLRKWTGISAFIRYRRMAGLFVYFYAGCHFLIWFVADHGLNFGSMIADIVKRPYITFGFTAFLLLTPLAVTSNQWSMKKLGKQWKRLHQLVYATIVLGVAHYLWLVKADYLEPMIYAVIASLLLLLRTELVKVSGKVLGVKSI
jgi:sulfoxide reductase heme-binding subunit YedZ